MNRNALSGRERGHFFVKRTPSSPEIVKRPLRQLDPAEVAEVAQNKAMVCAHMPKLVQIIKELHEFGLIDGWRSVGKVVLFADGRL